MNSLSLSLKGLFQSAKPSDSVTILFSLAFAISALLSIDRSPSLINLFVLYMSFVFFQFFLVWSSPLNGFLRFTRDLLFPLVAVFSIFDGLTTLIPAVNPSDIDYLLIRMDYLIFGGYPTVYLERFQNPILSDILQVSYSLYYFLPFMLGISLKIKGAHDAFDRSLFLILLCFYLSYVGYMAFPALGPRYAMEHLQGTEVVDGIISGQLRGLLNQIEGTKRDAFPSGHTGISILVLILSWHYSRRLFIPFFIMSAGIIAATVYFRYHYVIDLIGGLALTVVTMLLGKVYYAVYKRGINDCTYH